MPVEKTDLLLIPGDVAPLWSAKEQVKWVRETFEPWLHAQPVGHIVAIAGNHDLWLNEYPNIARSLPWTYLNDEGIEIDGVRIWGSPYAPIYGPFPFMKKDAHLAEHWEKIPTDTHILMTHGPVYGRRDAAENLLRQNEKYGSKVDPHVGSKTLRNRLEYGGYHDLKIVACGHIHEGWGHEHHDGVTYINASYVNRRMRPQNPAVSFDFSIPDRV